MITLLDWLENHSMQSLEDRSSHSSNSAGALFAFEAINQLLNEVYATSVDLYDAADYAYGAAEDAVDYFYDITFSQFC